MAPRKCSLRVGLGIQVLAIFLATLSAKSIVGEDSQPDDQWAQHEAVSHDEGLGSSGAKKSKPDARNFNSPELRTSSARSVKILSRSKRQQGGCEDGGEASDSEVLEFIKPGTEEPKLRESETTTAPTVEIEEKKVEAEEDGIPIVEIEYVDEESEFEIVPLLDLMARKVDSAQESGGKEPKQQGLTPPFLEYSPYKDLGQGKFVNPVTNCNKDGVEVEMLWNKSSNIFTGMIISIDSPLPKYLCLNDKGKVRISRPKSPRPALRSAFLSLGGRQRHQPLLSDSDESEAETSQGGFDDEEDHVDVGIVVNVLPSNKPLNDPSIPEGRRAYFTYLLNCQKAHLKLKLSDAFVQALVSPQITIRIYKLGTVWPHAIHPRRRKGGSRSGLPALCKISLEPRLKWRRI